MRKSMIGAALGLALTVGVTGVASAQSNDRPQAPRAGMEGRRGPGRHAENGRRGGPEQFLLKGITLSADQQARLKALRQENRTQMQASRDAHEKTMDEVRAARQRGDTAAVRAQMEKMRSEMQRHREQQLAQVRSILTAEQQKQFDANVAELEKTRAQRGPRDGGHGWGGRGHGQHGDSTGQRGRRS